MGVQELHPGRESERKQIGLGVGVEVQFREEEVGSGSYGPPEEPLAAGALFKGKKWIFQQPQSLYCCTKGCIDHGERSAWQRQSRVCSAGSLLRPFARGAQTVPGCQAPAVRQAPARRLLTNTAGPGALAPGAKDVHGPREASAQGDTHKRAEGGYGSVMSEEKGEGEHY